MPGPFETLALGGGSAPLYVLRFDEEGALLSPEAAREAIAAARDGDHTDVLVLCHGWNNAFDVALERYRKIIAATEAARAAHASSFAWRPLVVGLTWPSIIMLRADEQPPQIAGEAFADVDASTVELLASDPRLAALVAKGSLDADEALALATALVGHGVREDGVGETDPGEVEAEALVAAVAGRAAGPVPGQPGFVAGGAEPGLAAAGSGSVDARGLLRTFTVLQMKDRAGTVGRAGVATFLRALLRETSRPVHAAGHSYGSRVLLNAISVDPAPSRALRSLLLLQPAVNARCFAKDAGKGRPGGYRPAFGRVELPIFVTYSEHDAPLRKLFHLAARRKHDLGELIPAATPWSKYAALGGYGAQRTEESLAVAQVDAPAPYPLDTTREVLSVDCTKGIAGHGDVANATTGWALLSLLRAGAPA